MPAWLVVLALVIAVAVLALGGVATSLLWLGGGVLLLGVVGIALDRGSSA
ncbi:hypothetical protein [Aquipuribacter hungaricus]|uniref:DUF4175 domain-containing protein n=1 Tax=Aquipuribacter hungaricus TaxID=545624 RepID=A0ABV7WB47_9MICO